VVLSGSGTIVKLVRHGETEYNRTDRYMGRADLGLNATGRDQAARLARRLPGEGKVDALYTSPLARTTETAGFLEPALGVTACPEPGLLEIDLGPWEGRQRSEVAQEDPERWKLWLTDPTRVRVAGMESIEELRRRVGETLDGLAVAHAGGRIVVVTHFACVVTAVLHALDLPSASYRRFPVANTSVTVLRIGGFNTLGRFNDTAHLTGD
jgi:broad specificity phosphatase PhoE